MSHILYALKKQKENVDKIVIDNKTKYNDKKTRRRHHASRHHKTFEVVEKSFIDCDDPDQEEMYKIAAEWWNSWREVTFIKEISEGWEKAVNKDEFLKKEYYKLANQIPEFHKNMGRYLFHFQFNYCIPNFFIPWLEDLEMEKRTRLKGNLECEILDIIGKRPRIKVNELYSKISNFPAVIDAALTRMVNKGVFYIEYSRYKEKFYVVTNKLKTDKMGYYLEKN